MNNEKVVFEEQKLMKRRQNATGVPGLLIKMKIIKKPEQAQNVMIVVALAAILLMGIILVTLL